MKRLIVLLLLASSLPRCRPFAPETNSELSEAVFDWCGDSVGTESSKGSPISFWDTSKISNMAALFKSQASCNPPLARWDTGSVTNMYQMFSGASAFNQPLGDWDTGAVTDMEDMFSGASAFNRPIGDWDTSEVTTMTEMFENAAAFDQPLNKWDVDSVSVTNMFAGSSIMQECHKPGEAPCVTSGPSMVPTASPASHAPTSAPTHSTTRSPSTAPTDAPTASPASTSPTVAPTAATTTPTTAPTTSPTQGPSKSPTHSPSSASPTAAPSTSPTAAPTDVPTAAPTSNAPTVAPTSFPTTSPTSKPSASPTAAPTQHVCNRGTHGCDAAHGACVVFRAMGSHVKEVLPNRETTGGMKLGEVWHFNDVCNEIVATFDESTTACNGYSLECWDALLAHGKFREVTCFDVSENQFTCTCGEGFDCISGCNTIFVGTTHGAHVCVKGSDAPTAAPASASPTQAPTASPTASVAPTESPTATPTSSPSQAPTETPTDSPTVQSNAPTSSPTLSLAPSSTPSASPTVAPSPHPSGAPTPRPTASPTMEPTAGPTKNPSRSPTSVPIPAPAPAPAPDLGGNSSSTAPQLCPDVTEFSLSHVEHLSMDSSCVCSRSHSHMAAAGHGNVMCQGSVTTSSPKSDGTCCAADSDPAYFCTRNFEKTTRAWRHKYETTVQTLALSHAAAAGAEHFKITFDKIACSSESGGADTTQLKKHGGLDVSHLLPLYVGAVLFIIGLVSCQGLLRCRSSLETELERELRDKAKQHQHEHNAANWSVFTDDESQKTYYHNAKTGKTMWKMPSALRMLETEGSRVSLELVSLTKRLTHGHGSDDVNDKDEDKIHRADWDIHTDDESQKQYYHNRKTGETVWRPPWGVEATEVEVAIQNPMLHDAASASTSPESPPPLTVANRRASGSGSTSMALDLSLDFNRGGPPSSPPPAKRPTEDEDEDEDGRPTSTLHIAARREVSSRRQSFVDFDDGTEGRHLLGDVLADAIKESTSTRTAEKNENGDDDMMVGTARMRQTPASDADGADAATDDDDDNIALLMLSRVSHHFGSRHQVLPPLPAGWTEHTDEATGDTFYFNSNTNKTSMIRPTSTPAPKTSDGGNGNEMAAAAAVTDGGDAHEDDTATRKATEKSSHSKARRPSRKVSQLHHKRLSLHLDELKLQAAGDDVDVDAPTGGDGDGDRDGEAAADADATGPTRNVSLIHHNRLEAHLEKLRDAGKDGGTVGADGATDRLTKTSMAKKKDANISATNEAQSATDGGGDGDAFPAVSGGTGGDDDTGTSRSTGFVVGMRVMITAGKRKGHTGQLLRFHEPTERWIVRYSDSIGQVHKVRIRASSLTAVKDGFDDDESSEKGGTRTRTRSTGSGGHRPHPDASAFTPGSQVVILAGKHKGQHGRIRSFNEEKERWVVGFNDDSGKRCKVRVRAVYLRRVEVG